MRECKGCGHSMVHSGNPVRRTAAFIRWLSVFVVALGCFGYSAFAENERIQWTKQWGTTGIETGAAVAVDGAGNVYVAGGADSGLDGNVNAGQFDAYVTKYDAAGVKQWTREWGTTANEFAYAVAADGSGNVYVTGITEAGLDGNVSSGSLDIFVTKFDASGIKKWTGQWGTATQEWAEGIYVSSPGDVYVVGDTGGGMHGNVSSGGRDIVVLKINTSGVRQWTRQWGSAGTENGWAVLVDESENVYAAGSTSSAFDGNVSAGHYDVFLTKINAAGARQWTRQWGTTGRDDIPSLARDSSGNMYITGMSSGTLEGIASAGKTDAFLAKVDSAGVKQWTRQWGTSASDGGMMPCLDSEGNVYVAGYTAGGIDGNISAGDWDAFLTKFNAAGVRQWTRQWGTAGEDQTNDAAIDGAGNIYVTGYTVSAGNYDIFLTKFYPNHAPALAWTGEAGYTAVGVSPAAGVRSSTYTYRVTYTDTDNDAPAAGYPKLHVKKSGVEISGSPFVMNYVSGSSDSGAVYCASTTLQTGSDYTYYFEACDALNAVAAGSPTAAAGGPTVNVTQPQLAWTGEAGYTAVGVSPATGLHSSTYTYRVTYSDTESDAPAAGYPKLHIKKSGVEISGSPFTMNFVSGSNDTGAVYSATATLLSGNDYTYYFEAEDIVNTAAAGAPTGAASGPTVNITRPQLAWTGEEHYTGDGVYPKTITGGSYRYRVLYSHAENDAPLAGYPRVHITSNGLDIAGSPFTMSLVDGTGDYVAGRIYEYAATGLGGEYAYYFEARDVFGNTAVGAPTVQKSGPTAVSNPPGTGDCKVFHSVFKPGNAEKCYVTFNAPQAGEFTVRVYDGTGRQVEELFRGSVNPGVTSVTWDGKWDGGIAATSGVYIVQISGPGINQRKNVVVIR